MGWVGSVPGCFGKCLIECIEQVIEDKGLLLREGFRKILKSAAKDWCSIAASLNGGNDTYYNLYRMGSKIDDIGYHCCGPILYDGSVDERIDWKKMLKDIKWVSEVVLFEMQRNLVSVDPNDYNVKVIDYPQSPHQRTRKYERYVPQSLTPKQEKCKV